jgi:hypothetical protein
MHEAPGVTRHTGGLVNALAIEVPILGPACVKADESSTFPSPNGFGSGSPPICGASTKASDPSVAGLASKLLPGAASSASRLATVALGPSADDHRHRLATDRFRKRTTTMGVSYYRVKADTP